MAPSGGRGESAQLRSLFLLWIPLAKLWVRQPDEFSYLAKRPLSRVLPHPLTREPPPGGSPSGRPMVAPTVCTLYLRRWRRLPTATHIRPRQRKDIFFTLPNTLPAFSLVAPGAKKKLSKRNAKGRRLRGIFEKIPLKIPQKLFGNRCRDVGRVHPKQRASRLAPPQGGF